MKASDVMTRNVRAVKLTTPVRKIAQIMVARRISAVPVLDASRRVLGIVSEGDLLRRTEAGTERPRSWWFDLLSEPRAKARDYVRSRGALARDVMTRSVISVTPSTDVADIADLMERWNIKRVTVVSGGKLAGIVSRRDLVKAIGRKKPAGRARISDADLRQRLQNRLNAQSWVARSVVNFVVDKGRVELFGFVGTEDQRDAVRVMAENTAGVRAVNDRLAIMPRTADHD